MSQHECELCGAQAVREARLVKHEYKGHSFDVMQPGVYCDACGESVLEPEDLKATREQLQAAKSEIDGLLTPFEIKRIRLKLNLNQRRAGDVFGGGKNAFSRYEHGEVPVPKSTSGLLAMLDRHPELVEEFMEEAYG